MAQFEIYRDRQDEYRWGLRADNNEVIADSGEGYQEKRKCEAGIDDVRQQAPDAQVEDQT